MSVTSPAIRLAPSTWRCCCRSPTRLRTARSLDLGWASGLVAEMVHRPLSVQGVLRLLEDTGFQAAALDVRGDRDLLLGRRPV